MHADIAKYYIRTKYARVCMYVCTHTYPHKKYGHAPESALLNSAKHRLFAETSPRLPLALAESPAQLDTMSVGHERTGWC